MRRLARLLPLVAALTIPAAQAANPPQVAFKAYSNRTSLVLLDQTGGNPREVTQGKPGLTSLGAYSWSPDGTRVVYASGATIYGGDLYVLGVDDGRVERVTTDGANEDPAWSPDGARIAYVHGERAPREVWLLDVAQAHRRRLTTDGGLKEEPRWSPDGTRLAYFRDGETFVVDVASGRRVLNTRDYRAAWSPDGGRLAFLGGRVIAVAGADGSGRRAIATKASEGPQWSPDGSLIAFSRWHCTAGLKGWCGDTLSSIYVVGADGGNERRLTGPVGGGPRSQLEGQPFDHSTRPVWWPDGSRIFFRQDSRQFVMNADGTCEQPFGPRELQLGDPAWRPGSRPSLPPLRCADLRVRTQPARLFYGRRDRPRIRVALENDGNQTATGLVLRLQVTRGRGRVRPPSTSCSGVEVVQCPLPPLEPGQSRQLTFSVTGTSPRGFDYGASASAREPDSAFTQNVSTGIVAVLECDVVGTDGSDRLVGTRHRDSICGLPGGDVILAGAGDDTIAAGAGADTIRPGPGRDVVDGGEGRERVYARDGQRDRIDCGRFLDTVYADRVDKLVSCERVSRR